MPNRATAAFVFSITGAAYQLTSLFVAALVDRNKSFYLYNLGYETVLHKLHRDLEGQPHSRGLEWPNNMAIDNPRTRNCKPVHNYPIILLASIASIPPVQRAISRGDFGPDGWTTLIVIGGILGFSAVRQYSREHGPAVIAHA
jgi:hypothetical protein